MLLSGHFLHALTAFSLQICISWIFHIIAILLHVAFDFWLFSSVESQLCGCKCLPLLFVYVILGFRDRVLRSPGLSGTCYVARMLELLSFLALPSVCWIIGVHHHVWLYPALRLYNVLFLISVFCSFSKFRKFCA